MLFVIKSVITLILRNMCMNVCVYTGFIFLC